jgi:hypothetical protein
MDTQDVFLLFDNSSRYILETYNLPFHRPNESKYIYYANEIKYTYYLYVAELI